MRKLIIFLVAGMLWCSISVAKDYFIEERSDGVRMIWNIKDAKEISMMQYEIKYTTRPGKEKLIYNRKIVRELYKFCDKPAGKYKATSEMHYLGKTDREDRGVIVSQDESAEDVRESKQVTYWIPYYRFLNNWDIDNPSEWGDISMTCEYRIHEKKDTKEYRSRKYMIDWNIELMNKDRNSFWYVDCDRLMWDQKEDFQRGQKISWGTMRAGTNGEYYLKTVCKYLGFNN